MSNIKIYTISDRVFEYYNQNSVNQVFSKYILAKKFSVLIKNSVHKKEKIKDERKCTVYFLGNFYMYVDETLEEIFWIGWGKCRYYPNRKQGKAIKEDYKALGFNAEGTQYKL